MLDGTAIERVTELKDTELSFERHIRSIAVSPLSELGIIRKGLCLFGDPVLVLRCPVWLCATWSTNVVSLHFACFSRFIVTVVMP